MKKSQLVALICFGTALILLLTLLPLARAENLYDSVIRIHVLANSDSPADQEKKLLVRDEVLRYAKDHYNAKMTRGEAEENYREDLDTIRRLAEEVLRENGDDKAVSVTLCEEYYPTREYESLSLPAGNYLSLRVLIGEAKGKNWWCVLFPPICLNSSMKTEDALAEVGMEEDNIYTVVGCGKEYRYRFKILELWEEAKSTARSLF